MSKIFKSAIFWILLSGFLLALLLFFLLPAMGVKGLGARFLWASLPIGAAALAALIVSIFRLKKALKGQEQAQANPFEMEAAVKPWLEPLKAETKHALDILKQSGKGKVKMGQDPLDIFRFYLVFGNPGAGRTSLLEHSGIHFPRRYPSAADLAKQTRHFSQWWFSNQGIFLEAPTRYATGEEGDDEFQFWLTQLEKEGKRTALDGMLLVVSLRELLDGGPGATELASRYREKIALAMGTLRLELPVYLVFTHADLLPGFREFFENMQEPESHQVFGATFALRGNLAPARQRFEREYKKIWESLQSRTAQRLSQAADPGRKKQIFLFPNEFGAAQERIASFVEHLFKDTMRRERALFRGFFLTSVMPSEASDFARASDPFQDAGGEAAHFLDHKAKMRGPAASAAKPDPISRPRSFFTFLLFGGVLKNDKSLAQIPGYRLGSLSRRALIASAAMTLAGLAISIYGLIGFIGSRSYLNGVSKAVTEAGRLRWRAPGDFRAEYEVLSGLLAKIRDIQAGGGGHLPPGFRHSSEALELASTVHSIEVGRMAAADALRNLAATLEMSSKFYNPAEHARLRDNLKLYLMLTGEGRKHLKEMKPPELAALLAPLWAQEATHKFGIENLPNNLETGLEDHAAFFSERFLDGDIAPLDRGDANLVQTSRQSLMGTPSIEGLYASIEAGEDGSRDLGLTDMGVPADAALKSSAKVRGFYTKAAFEDDAMDRLAQGAEEPHQRDWVLGEGAVATLPPEMQDQKQLYRALVDRYYQAYAEEWMRFLQSLSVRLPGDPGQASGKLSGFASATQGLPSVLARLLAETNLLVPAPAAQGAVQKKLGKAGKLLSMALEARDADKKKLKEQFRFVEELNGGPSGAGLLQDYFTAARGLSEVLGKLALAGDNGADVMEAAQALFAGKSESPLNTCWNEANKIRARYENQTWLPPLLENPVRDVAGYLASAAGSQLEAAYKAKVFSPYNQNLRGRYPLMKAGSQEVNLEDLKAFFGPDKGAFTLFFTGKLAPFVKVEEESITPKHWNGIRLKFSRPALDGIAKAYAVGRRMYADAGLRVYNINITLAETRNTAKVTFRMGEDKISVKPGEVQARQTFRWPNENSYKGAEIIVDNVNGGSQNRRVDGAWGFLKLLDGARALNVRTGGLTAKWRFNVAQKYDVDVSIEGNIPDRENPFTMPEYFRFELPASLMAEDGRVSMAGN
ncbi:MAG TPA: type VI secretion system membrane subunit TssM [Fibrobacteria bacterium]|nr:type VI secretion system membrane subunit TssM [Fibrobacteria bacterium]